MFPPEEAFVCVRSASWGAFAIRVIVVNKAVSVVIYAVVTN